MSKWKNDYRIILKSDVNDLWYARKKAFRYQNITKSEFASILLFRTDNQYTTQESGENLSQEDETASTIPYEEASFDYSVALEIDDRHDRTESTITAADDKVPSTSHKWVLNSWFIFYSYLKALPKI